MSAALLTTDEEVDTGPYLRYLRALSDADLLDIARHTDPELYPARCDMAAREARRRGVVARALYSPAEFAVRCLSVAAICVCAVPLLLACVLDAPTARGGTWPDAAALADGATATRVLTLLLVGTLRVLLAVCVHTGLFALLVGVLTGWLLTHVRSMRNTQAGRDVGQLALAALLVMAGTLLAAEHSAVALLFPSAPRGCSLLDPFGLLL